MIARADSIGDAPEISVNVGSVASRKEFLDKGVTASTKNPVPPASLQMKELHWLIELRRVDA